MSRPITREESKPPQEEGSGPDSFWARHGDDVVLALLLLYVVLLGIGTVAELFDIRSILSWPIYR